MKPKHTISILCNDTPGVLARIAGLFSRRGFNIASLSVGNTEARGKSRFTIVVQGDERILEQVRKQLQKLVHVLKVWDIKPDEAIEREHALIKVEVERARRAEFLQIVTALEAKIVSSAGPIWTLEVTGDPDQVDNALNLFKDYTILESIRTGRIALQRQA